MANMASQAIYFSFYRLISDYIKDMRGASEGYQHSVGEFFVVTLLAGVICATACNPLWLLNTRMALSTDGKSLRETVADIIRLEGLGTFYKGLIPNLIMVINPLINYIVYESLKQKVGTSLGYSNVLFFVISSLSKSLATFLTYPILTIRVRLHASVALRTVTPGTPLATNIHPTGHSFAKRVRDNIAHTI